LKKTNKFKKSTKKTTKVTQQKVATSYAETKQTVQLSGTNESIPIEAAQQLAENVKPNPALIYITGESPMVEQYAEICAAKGYDVCVSWNEQPFKLPEFKSSKIKILNSIPANVSIAIELTNIDLPNKRKNLEKIEKQLPGTSPILSSSITVTATEQCSWISGKHRLIGVSALPTFIEKPLVEVAPTIYSPKETLEVVSRFFHSLGKEIEIVQDRIGMVFPRILCQVINEAAFSVTEDVASPQDIDKVLKLGLNFPLGPIEWAEQIGLKQVYAVLKALYTDLHEERYRIAPLLKQMSITGEWWK
jgi:3-hydroxybutyryl-CoA dehydrogenase